MTGTGDTTLYPYDDGDGGSTEQRCQCYEDPDTGEVTYGDWKANGCCRSRVSALPTPNISSI